MNSLNVLRLDARPSWYLRHPIKFFKEIRTNLRFARQRIVRGYADCDWWGMDEFLLQLLPGMLRDMSDKGYAYPGNDDFPTPEAWSTWLHSTADVLESLQEDNWEGQNEYEDEWLNGLVRTTTTDENGNTVVSFTDTRDEDIHELFLARQEELNNKWQQLLNDTMVNISQHWHCLWD